MFAVLKELKVPQEIQDKLIQAITYGTSEKFAIEFLEWIKAQEQLNDAEKTLRANVLNWAIGTITIGLALGIGLEKNELENN